MKGSALILISITICLFAAGQTEFGKCTWYGAEGEIPEGYYTYCGVFHRLNMETAYYNVPSLPCGTKIRVTNTANNKTVDVIINDKGPNGRPGYILDLTYAAFGVIGNRDDGVINCTYKVI